MNPHSITRETPHQIPPTNVTMACPLIGVAYPNNSHWHFSFVNRAPLMQWLNETGFETLAQALCQEIAPWMDTC